MYRLSPSGQSRTGSNCVTKARCSMHRAPLTVRARAPPFLPSDGAKPSSKPSTAGVPKPAVPKPEVAAVTTKAPNVWAPWLRAPKQVGTKQLEPVKPPTEALVPTAPKVPQFPGPNDPRYPPQRAFAAILLDQITDSATDVARHLGRINKHAAPPEAERLVPGDSGRMRLRASSKPVVLVLGSGWGAHSLIKVIDTDTYDVVVVSPRNHFLFTPMLPSTAVGTVEFRSLLEPVRTSNPCVTYLEAACDSLDPASKVAVCTSSFAHDDGRRPQFEIQYDKAVIAVGEQPATFGVPGVRENCYFMKEVTDAVELRKRIAQKFELASLPGTSEQDRRAALHFVVVGGGPTGVEFAGTLSDFLREDLKKKYPALMPHVRVTMLQSAQSILTQFDEGLVRRAVEALTACGVAVRTGVRVVEVTPTQVLLAGGEALDYGVCVWSAGNAPRPLVQQLAGAVPLQAQAAEASGAAPKSKLVVDSFLRVVGARDLLALGDCSLVLGNRLPPTAQVAGQQGAYLAHLINSGYALGVGGYTQPPPFTLARRDKLQGFADNRPLVQWLALALKGGRQRVAVEAEVANALFRMDAPPWMRVHCATCPRVTGEQPDSAPAVAAGGADVMPALRSSRPCMLEFEAAALAAAEAGCDADDALEVHYWDRPFEFLNMGMLAYVGQSRALTQVEAFDVISLRLYGTVAFMLWKGVYISKQVSLRNRVLILFDWMKARVFGRDISLF